MSNKIIQMFLFTVRDIFTEIFTNPYIQYGVIRLFIGFCVLDLTIRLFYRLIERR